MIRLITPPGILFSVALLAIYAVYGYLLGTTERSWPLLAGAALSAVAAVGLAMLKPWARYPVYLLTLGFIAKLAHSIYEGFNSGYYSFQFGTAEGIAYSMLPSLIMVILALICCWLVNRRFTMQRTSASLPFGKKPSDGGPGDGA